MDRCVRLMLTCGVLGVASALAGCGSGGHIIKISYSRSPEYKIPSSVKRVALVQFIGKTEQDKRWGDIAAEKLASVLVDAQQRHGLFQVYDRKQLKVLLAERDLAIALDASSAREVGRLANVHAVVYGTVAVTTRDTEETGWHGTRFYKVSTYTKRYCQVNISLIMDDVSTGRTIAAVALARDYDSTSKAKENGAMSDLAQLGTGPGEPEPTEQAVNRLIDECVAAFMAKISPHQVSATVELEPGLSELVLTGNKLAAQGDYDEALECYQAAIRINPLDCGAMFNAAVAHEAKGDLSDAEAMYTKAFKCNPNEKYILSRRRVRQEMRP